MRRNKYGVAPKEERTFNGKVYPSKAEMTRAEQHAIASKVDGYAVVEQPKFTLGCPENVYRADFLLSSTRPIRFFLADGRTVTETQWVEDVKGVETAKFKRDVKLWRSYGPCVLVILKRSGGSWKRTYVVPGEPAPKVKRKRRTSPAV